jgi:hypothetical protein
LDSGQEWGAIERVTRIEAKLGMRKQEVGYLPQRRRHRQGMTPIDSDRQHHWSAVTSTLSLSLSILSLESVSGWTVLHSKRRRAVSLHFWARPNTIADRSALRKGHATSSVVRRRAEGFSIFLQGFLTTWAILYPLLQRGISCSA